MSFQNLCTICEKDFSLQIKLKKHISLVHLSEEGDYLDVNVTLSCDDKIKYFDVLRFKYHSLLIKIKLFEATDDTPKDTSFSTIKIEEDQISSNQTEILSNEIEPSKTKRIKTSNQKEVEDEFCPESWRTILNAKNKKMFNVESNKYLLRVEALRYMLDKSYSDESIQRMKQGLIVEDNWIGGDNVSDWLVKKTESKSTSDSGFIYFYLSPKFEFFRSMESAIACLRAMGGPDEEASKLKKLLDWEENPELPTGWMHSQRKTESGYYRVYLSPEGKYCQSISILYKHLMKAGTKAGTTDHKKVRMLLMIDGWQEESHLPTNWMVKKKKKGRSKYVFLTSKGDKLNNCRAALKFMLKNSFSELKVNTFRRIYKHHMLKEENMIEKREENEEEKLFVEINRGQRGCYIPEGWVMEAGKYRTPDGGKLLRTFKDVIIHMRSNSYPEEEIQKFKSEGSTLNFEVDDKLPKGWMSAVSTGLHSSGVLKLLTPEGDFINGRASAIKFMISNNYPQSDIDSMKKLLVTDDGWEHEEKFCGSFLKKDFRSQTVYMTPNFEVFRTKKRILEYLAENGFTADEIKHAENNITIKKRKVKNIQSSYPNKKPKLDIDDKGQSSSQSEIKNEPLINKSLEDQDQSINSSPINTSKNFDESLAEESEQCVKDGLIFQKSKSIKSFGKNTDGNEHEYSRLPNGWSFHGRYFKSSDGIILKTLKAAILHMKNKSYKEEEIIKFKMHGSSFPFQPSKKVPLGWMIAEYIGPNNLPINRFLSPDGEIFGCRASAIKFMVAENYDCSTIDQMKQMLIVEDGFEEVQCLPKSWLMKKRAHDTKFLSPTFETFYKKSEVIKYLKSHVSTESELKIAHDYLFNGKAERRPTEKKINEDVDTKTLFSSVSLTDDHVLSNSSGTSGLPSGWSIRNKRYHTQDGKSLFTLKEAIHYMQINSYSEDAILKFKQFGSAVPFRPEKSLPVGWMSAKQQGPNSVTMHKFLSPNGDYFQSRVSAIKFMIDSNYEPDDIEIMRNLLKTEDGYEEDVHLPGSWLRRKKSNTRLQRFISPTFESFKKKIDVIEYLNNYGCSLLEVKKAKKYLFGESSNKLNSNYYRDQKRRYSN